MRHTSLSILVLGLDSEEYANLRFALSSYRIGITWAESFSAARPVFAEISPDVVVVDDDALEESLETFLDRVHQEWPSAQIILMRSSRTPGPIGVGAGLLYCGVKPLGASLLARLLDATFPGRLETLPVSPENKALILCVDDDTLYLKSLCRILGRHGYRTASYERPAEALKDIPSIGARLAIVDVGMPGMDGLAFTREVTATTRGSMPVVLLTGRQSASDIMDGYANGASYYITKPCSPNRVIRIVDYLAGELEDSERERLEVEL